MRFTLSASPYVRENRSLGCAESQRGVCPLYGCWRFSKGGGTTSFSGIVEANDFSDLRLLREILELPIISETPQGGFIWSFIDYRLDRASFQGLGGECSIKQGPWHKDFPFVAVLPANAAAPALVRKPFGVRLVTDCSITFPVRMGEQDGLLQPKPKREHAATVTSRLMARLRGRW